MSITNLVELQEIDSQLEDLNSLLGDLPKMVADLNDQESSLQTKIDNDKISLKDVNLNTNKSETILGKSPSKLFRSSN